MSARKPDAAGAVGLGFNKKSPPPSVTKQPISSRRKQQPPREVAAESATVFDPDTDLFAQKKGQTSKRYRPETEETKSKKPKVDESSDEEASSDDEEMVDASEGRVRPSLRSPKSPPKREGAKKRTGGFISGYSGVYKISKTGNRYLVGRKDDEETYENSEGRIIYASPRQMEVALLRRGDILNTDGEVIATGEHFIAKGEGRGTRDKVGAAHRRLSGGHYTVPTVRKNADWKTKSKDPDTMIRSPRMIGATRHKKSLKKKMGANIDVSKRRLGYYIRKFIKAKYGSVESNKAGKTVLRANYKITRKGAQYLVELLYDAIGNIMLQANKLVSNRKQSRMNAMTIFTAVKLLGDLHHYSEKFASITTKMDDIISATKGYGVMKAFMELAGKSGSLKIGEVSKMIKFQLPTYARASFARNVSIAATIVLNHILSTILDAGKEKMDRRGIKTFNSNILGKAVSEVAPQFGSICRLAPVGAGIVTNPVSFAQYYQDVNASYQRKKKTKRVAGVKKEKRVKSEK